MFSNFFSENRDVYKKMSKNFVKPERPQMTIWCQFACWISKATCEKHTEECVIIAFQDNCYTKAPQCYFKRTLPVFLHLIQDIYVLVYL
jgi:hypothetical protein